MANTVNVNMNVANANLAMLNKKIDLMVEEYMNANDLTDEDKRILAAKDDEAFMKQVVLSKTPEEMQKLFNDRDIHLTLEEVNQFIEDVVNTTTSILNATDELSEDELEEITGGLGLVGKIVAGVISALVGVAGGIIVGTMSAVTGPGAIAAAITYGVASAGAMYVFINEEF